tara:strand:+ start:452 stop:1015 length:564 start_codon:yes stop_codon:yes gene_type:complete
MAFATIDVTKGITGTIPVANGGTGLTSGTSGQFLKFTGSTTIASAADNGKIAQVLTVEKAPAANSTTGDTFVTPSGASIDITPSATSSKILVMVQGGGTVVASNATVLYTTIYRDSTNLGNATQGFQRQYNNQRTDQPISMQCLDTPNTTSQVTYAVYYRSESSGNQVYLQDTASGVMTLVAMEILA